ncbi:hypothetical protein VARIO8X_90510 [Burkholderiales bacterium 8X]|nr:hypothetical protein VARIO8X_90510 [Burkholderiales bacterium 8X]
MNRGPRAALSVAPGGAWGTLQASQERDTSRQISDPGDTDTDSCNLLGRVRQPPRP